MSGASGAPMKRAQSDISPNRASPVGYHFRQRAQADELVVRAGQISPDARPLPVIRPCIEPRTDGIPLHIPGSGKSSRCYSA